MQTPIVIHNESGHIRAGLSSDDAPSVIFPTDSVTGKDPFNHNEVVDWDGMTKVWSHVYEQLGVDPTQHPVLLSEPPLNPKRNRETATKVFFETFGVPAFYTVIDSVLALYASGRTTGIVLNIGETITHVVPIFEGYALPHAIILVYLAGKELKELNALFEPASVGIESVGIQEAMYNSVMKCDTDLRSDLFHNMFIVGSSSAVTGICDRLEKEVGDLAPVLKVQAEQPSKPENAIWQGGDQLAPLIAEYGMWISKDEYAQYGATIVHRKCF